MECIHAHTAQEEDEIVCVDCGILMPLGGNLVRDQYAPPLRREITGHSLQTKTYTQRMTVVFDQLLNSLTHALQIPTMNDRIIHLFQESQRFVKIGFGKSGYMALGACTYILIREKSLPITLASVHVIFF